MVKKVSTIKRREKAVKELKNPKYVFVGSVADVLEKNKLYSKSDADYVIKESNFTVPRGSKKFIYEQLKTRKERKMRSMT